MTTIDPNVQAARVVGRRAELGWFDVEFIMHGCAYLQDGKLYYKVSSQAEDIYRFVDNAAVEGIYTSNVLKYTEKCAVPSGMHDLIANDVKKDLARKLQHSYSKTFFETLNQLSERTWGNGAAVLLWQEAEELEGVFSEEKIDFYESLVQYAYRHHGINSGTYQNIMRWIHEERKNMDDYLISKDFYEKTVYGFAYEKDGKIKYVDNALQSYVYEKAEKMEQEGYLITPILSHTYWYEQSRRVSEVLCEFRLLLETVYDAEYMTKIKTIRTHKTEINADTFNALLEQIKMSEGEYAFNTLLRYGYAWGILPLKK